MRPRPSARANARGLTLVEIMIVIAILLILFSVVVVTGKMTRDSTKQSTAKRHLAQIAAAINQYAAYWPAWRIGSVSLADKGWPHFMPVEVFGAPYIVQAGFNDYNDLSGPPFPASTWLSSGAALNTVELNANEVLVYALTTTSGGGPYFKSDTHDGMQVALAANGNALFYPTQPGAGGVVRQRFVDAWGRPFRYFWVYRDANAYRGYLPVRRADATDPNCPAGAPNCAKAAGFVLESAGPDGKYGDVWQASPIASDIADADDNLTVSP